jgi:hypothetical protein
MVATRVAGRSSLHYRRLRGDLESLRQHVSDAWIPEAQQQPLVGGANGSLTAALLDAQRWRRGVHHVPHERGSVVVDAVQQAVAAMAVGRRCTEPQFGPAQSTAPASTPPQARA